MNRLHEVSARKNINVDNKSNKSIDDSIQEYIQNLKSIYYKKFETNQIAYYKAYLLQTKTEELE